MRRPDFFIIGAPKCGTTALSQYLSEHPDVCFSKGKEPSYFCSDMGGMQQSFSETEYLKKEFSGCGHRHRAIGEGSVLYLYSKVAVPAIEKFNPAARYIVLFRNPIDAAYSLHSQQLYNLDEDQRSFEKAWQLQERRRNGNAIPEMCREPSLLMYQNMLSFGHQLQRLYKTVQPERVLVHLFDDICNNPKHIYERTLTFLGVESDGRTNFPVINSNKRHRSELLMRLSYRPPQWVQIMTRNLKQLTGVRRYGVSYAISKLVDRVNRKEVKREPLSADTRKILIEAFHNDICLLQGLICRDLSDWLKV